MVFYFQTRDSVSNDPSKDDYPNIGWFPNVPKDILYHYKNNVNAEVSTSTLFVSQNNGNWEIFMPCIGSSRCDYINRPIVVNLAITGTTIENPPIGLLYQYLFDDFFVSSNDKINKISKLKDFFDSKIQVGLPFSWIVNGEDRLKIGETICSDLKTKEWFAKTPDSFERIKSGKIWCAGTGRENIFKFLTFCEELLGGQREGVALAEWRYSRKKPYEYWYDMLIRSGSGKDFAGLIYNENADSLDNVEYIEFDFKSNIVPKQKETEKKTQNKFWENKWLILVVVLILGSVLCIRGCPNNNIDYKEQNPIEENSP